MGSPLSIARIAAMVIALAPLLHSQCAPPAWSAMNQFPGLSGMVYCATSWDPDGAGPLPPVLVVGGPFGYADTTAVNQVATWDGTAFHPLGAGFNSIVWALTVWNGQLIAGGYFTMSGTTPAPYVARWTGTSWEPIGTGLNWSVFSLGVWNGFLVAGGYGLIGNSSVARWDGVSWQPLAGMTDEVLALTTYNGQLIAGTAHVPCVSAWNGSTWQTIGGGTNSTQPYFPTSIGGCNALAVFNGDLVAGGAFNVAGGVSVNNVARWNGTVWQQLGQGSTGAVESLAVFNGQLIASSDTISAWNGSAWTVLGTLGGWTRVVTANNGLLYVGGALGSSGGTPSTFLAAWTGTGWTSIGNATNAAAIWVRSLLPAYGDLIVAGAGAVTGHLENVARWNGSSWTNMGLGMDLEVSVLGSYNGNVVAGGYFNTADGIPAGRIALWGGSGWLPLGGGIGLASDQVVALASYGGDLIAGGDFHGAGGAPIFYIARWNGSGWLPVGSGLPGQVTALCIYNGDLIAAGLFTPGVTPSHIDVARWNGTSWAALGTGLPSGNPWSRVVLAVFNGEIIAGGEFSTLGGSFGVARWNGSIWQPMGTGFSTVNALCVYGGQLVAAGAFGGTPGQVAIWNGASWQPISSPATPLQLLNIPGIQALSEYRGALIAGGTFAGIGTVLSPFVARWSSPAPLLTVAEPFGPGSGTVTLSNAWMIPGHEYYNIVSFDLCGGGPGTGPFAGLCFNNVNTLIQQALVPLGTPPFHYLATAPDASFGPFYAPIGLTFDMATVDVTGGAICPSAATRFTVN